MLPDESAGAADRLWTGLGGRSVLWVPALWWYEVANALTMARRQRRLTPADALRAFELYQQLPLHTESMLRFGSTL